MRKPLSLLQAEVNQAFKDLGFNMSRILMQAPSGGENMYVIWSEGKPVTVVKAKKGTPTSNGKPVENHIAQSTMPGFGNGGVPPPGRYPLRYSTHAKPSYSTHGRLENARSREVAVMSRERYVDICQATFTFSMLAE